MKIEKTPQASSQIVPAAETKDINQLSRMVEDLEGSIEEVKMELKDLKESRESFIAHLSKEVVTIGNPVVDKIWVPAAKYVQASLTSLFLSLDDELRRMNEEELDQLSDNLNYARDKLSELMIK
jgi:hypothetical protein